MWDEGLSLIGHAESLAGDSYVLISHMCGAKIGVEIVLTFSNLGSPILGLHLGRVDRWS